MDGAQPSLIAGFGFSGFRSAYGPLLLLGPLSKVTLFAGPNNSGKSNMLLFASRFIKGGGFDAIGQLDIPQAPDGAEHPFEFAIALREDDAVIQRFLEAADPTHGQTLRHGSY